MADTLGNTHGIIEAKALLETVGKTLNKVQDEALLHMQADRIYKCRQRVSDTVDDVVLGYTGQSEGRGTIRCSG